MLIRNRTIRKFAVMCLAISLVSQSTLTAFAGEPVSQYKDVELHEKGILTSRVVDMQGLPVAGETVRVHYQGKEIATAVSDEDGYVVVAGLRPGAHTLSTTVSAMNCRFWSKDTAPPSAVSVPAVVSDSDIVRGQFGAFNLPMVIYAGLTAAALFVAIEADSSADDAKKANAALRARVEALEAASP